MATLSPSVILKIHTAMVGAYPSPEAMDRLLGPLDRWFSDFVIVGATFGPNVLSALRTADDEGWLPRLLRAASNGVPADTELGALAIAYASSDYAAGVDHFTLCRLSGGYVMIDRDPLRRSMRRLYDPAGQRILQVTGKNCSGKSHTRRLILHLNEMLGTFELVDIDLEEQLRMLGPDHVFYPDDLARLLVLRLGYVDFVVAAPPEDQQWARWNLEFCTAFQARAANDQQRHWVVVDAFNKVPLSDQVIDLIKELAVRVSRELFRFRLVLVGYGASFPLGVLPTVMKDSPDPIGPKELTTFLLRYLKEERPDLSDEVRTDRVARALFDLLECLDCEQPDYLNRLGELLVDRLPQLSEEP